MSNNNNRTAALRDSIRTHRTHLLGLAGVLLLYALLGFFLAPWLIEKIAKQSLQDEYGAELRLANVAVNPFILSLTIDGLELDDPAGGPLLRVKQVFVNFQASSLFRWAMTFDEFRVDAPELFLQRNDTGDLNIGFLAADSDSVPADEESSGLPRVLIFNFAINDSIMNWLDRMPPQAVETRLGPVNIEIVELNTLPQRSGQQTVVITTESSGTLSWTGDLQLNPLVSHGRATIEGRQFDLPSKYLQQETGFSVLQGQSDIDFAYRLAVGEDGIFRASIDDFSLRFTDVLMHKGPTESDAAASEIREVLQLPELRATGGSLRWPEKTANLQSLNINGAEVSIYRDEQGAINWITADASDTGNGDEGGEAQARSAATQTVDDEWRISLDKLIVDDLIVGFEDHSVEPFADVGLTSLDLELTSLDNQPGTEIPARAEMVTRAGGTITLDGKVIALPAAIAEFDIVTEGVSLALLHPYIKPLADVNLDSGLLAMNAKMRSDPDEMLWLAGNFSVMDFLITETDEGSRLGSWDRVDLSGLELKLNEETLQIAQIDFKKAYADILIAEDGTVNLGRVEKGKQVATDEENEESPKADDVKSAEAGETAAEDALQIVVGRIVFSDAGADFADNSLPLPFAARIAELNGDISTVATGSSEPSQVELEGKVDEHGFVQVSGTVTPLAPALNTKLMVRFQNVEMPKFSSYSIPFAGREIASGKLDLDLGYEVRDSKLAGENRIVMRDFELGDKVEHPDAMSLPLGLAVALLKDPSGKIDIDLPVRGDLNDPEFRYGGLILKALGNLIVKIVASPFTLLGNLIGVEADELSQINFIAGRADLTPPELERIGNIAKALSLRPQLVLELPGAVDKEADGVALSTARVDELIEQRVAGDSGQGDEPVSAEQRQAALESLYSETTLAAPEGSLDALRQQYTTATVGENGEPGGEQFDATAYTAELRRQLIESQEVTEQELAALANERAANVRTAILELDAALSERIVIGKPTAVERGRKETDIPMKVTLSASGEVADVPAPQE